MGEGADKKNNIKLYTWFILFSTSTLADNELIPH